MRFYPLAGDGLPARQLAEDYAAARPLGRLRLGPERLYLRQRLAVGYLPYAAVARCVRRAVLMPPFFRQRGAPAQLETLVFFAPDGAELAQVLLPGATAARITMAELAVRLPSDAADALDKETVWNAVP